MKGNVSCKCLVLFVVTLFTITACSSTKNNQRGWGVKLTSCEARVHPVKTNATADFQACLYNHNRDWQKVDVCMLEQGWSEMQAVPCDETKLFYKRSQIDGCLESSMVNNKIEYPKMNACLAQFDEYQSDLSDTKAAIEKLLDEQVK